MTINYTSMTIEMSKAEAKAAGKVGTEAFKEMLALMQQLGYFVRLFYIGIDSADESLLRIQNRVKRGGHDIPIDDVERRFQGRWGAVAKVLPYCDIAEFYDNDNGFVKVAEYRNGEFFKVGNYSSKWLSELIDFMSV